jgi:acyl-coenzyme A synthetase/AMP-(fatty) acid ligase
MPADGRAPAVPLAAAITAHARRRPGDVALVWRRRATTYGELLARADAARAHVDGLGCPPGEPVGLVAPKSPASVALVLGCLLAGRRFLLPSVALGPEALDALFAQSGCRRVVRPEDVPAEPGLPVPALRAAPPAPVEANDVGFMLTTSGSTGLPKVVPLPSGAVDRFVGWAGAHFGLRPGTTVLNHAPLNFDLCLLDVWATLAHGGRVVLADPDQGVNAAHLYGLARDNEVEVVQGVPMLHALLVEAAAAAGQPLGSVRHAVFTGDAIPEKVLRALPGLFPAARLANVYGCTETNDSFLHELAPGDALATPVPIGRPLPGVEALVLDATGAVVDGPGAGELYVATPFQAGAYLDAGRHTGKFVPDPLGRDGRCWFRTGDLVRRRADGALLLDGRADFQVKVRGVAVNTAEVERVLLDHPDVLEAGVAAVEDPLAGRRLACSVRRAPGTRLNTLTLRQHCARHLPQAAIPSLIRIEDRPLPKTPTGKVDRRAVVPSP